MGGEQSTTGSSGSSGTNLGIGIGAAQGLMGIYGAYSQNRRIQNVMNADAANAQVQYGQINAAATLEQQKRSNDVHQARSRLRVLAGDSGLDFGGSFAELDRQASIDQQINDSITKENAYQNKQRVASGLSATLTQLASSSINPLTQGVQGGLSGFSTGLSIQSGLDRSAAARQSAGSADAAAVSGTNYSGMDGEIPEPQDMTVYTT